jgi:aryl-alcohol dehydrogenase-like predicted oxidoreductase
MALGWQLTLPYVTSPIIGASTAEQLQETLGAIGLRLTEEEMQRLDEVTGVERKFFQ